MLHVIWRTIALRNTLQTLFAKLMISSDFTLILHVFLAECVCFLTLMISSDFTLILRVFLAECVCFLTYIDELASLLAIIGFN